LELRSDAGEIVHVCVHSRTMHLETLRQALGACDNEMSGGHKGGFASIGGGQTTVNLKAKSAKWRQQSKHHWKCVWR